MPDQLTPRQWYGLFDSHEKTHTLSFVLAPMRWVLSSPQVNLRWRRVRFGQANKCSVPRTTRGVYSFVVHPTVTGQPTGAYVFYVGKVGAPDNTRGFHDRYREYLGELATDDPVRIQIALGLEQWQDAMWFYWAPVRKASQIAQCERSLIQCLKPPWNKTGTGFPRPPQPAFLPWDANDEGEP